MPARPCHMPEDCLAAVEAQKSARDACETAGGALGTAATAQRKAQVAIERVESFEERLARTETRQQHQDAVLHRIDRRTKWQSRLQWMLPVLVTAFGIYVGWVSQTQQARNDKAGYDGGRRGAHDEIRTQALTTEQIAIIAGKASAKEFAAEFTLRANPPPIASAHR
ncbi:MAG: hypothetical protein ABFD89_17805 [Bryobacteraceae bacterium]